jgi:prepilin-type N-terminal cleavage/methylation domain-containing protein
MMTWRKKSAGFSLIELLVVLAIVAVLIIALLMYFNSPLHRAQDSRSKKDLFDLRVAFNEYYNDNYCYPPAEWFNDASDCGSDQFAPYINEIKCDPQTNLPYVVEYDGTGCEWFKIYTDLHYQDDDVCEKFDTGSGTYNYGVSSDNTTVNLNCDDTPGGSTEPSPSSSPGTTPSPDTSPTPDPNEGSYYCRNIDDCVFYNKMTWTCTPNYMSSDCDGACTGSTGACTLD